MPEPPRGVAADIEHKLLPPLVAAGVMAVVALFTCLFALAYEADDLAQRRDENLATMATTAWSRRINESLVAEAAWDDAVVHVANRLDEAWIDRNMALWFNHAMGLERMLVVTPDARTAYAAVDGRRVAPDRLQIYLRAAGPLLDRVRLMETRRPPMRRPDGLHRITAPVQVSAYARLDGRPQLLTATLIEPDFGAVGDYDPHKPAPVMVTAKEVDADAVAHIGRNLILPGLQLAPPGRAHDWTTNAVPIASPDGPAVATLTWPSRRPGSSIARGAAPVVVFAALVILLGGAWLVTRTRRLARGLVATQAHALHVALHDAFTGLANRTLFEDRLGMAVEWRRRHGGVVGVFVIDLDRFKQVNDTLGHAAGDQLIQEAARRIRQVCRNTDTVARLGGDEFAVVQSDATSTHNVQTLAQRLSQALSGAIELIGGPTRLSASIGVAVVDSEVEPAEAIRRADLALYRAKDKGRGRYVLFADEMDESARVRLQLSADLGRALDEGELEVAYQPQFTPRGRRMEAVEALVRWRHPKLGRVSPDVFIPIAEEGELIDRIGLYVLARACEDSVRWPGVITSVNLSAAQLRRDGLVEAYVETVLSRGRDPSMIELELTETVLLERDERTAGALRRLHEAGFRLALDDFGAGHSSLSYLRLYPLDKLKIDRSYVAPLGCGGEDEAMVVAIVRLARALGLAVTAEGVETMQQLEVLARAGCSLVQGFLFSPPVPAEQIEALLNPESARIAA
jgi:diguanylate cyclase (GGDEF)-like protein